MNLVTREIFGNNNLKYNTEIGGVASVISSSAILATKLGINNKRIRNFKVIGNDIKCKISGSYVIPNGTFLNTLFTNASPTYYKDNDGLVTSLGVSSFASSLNTTFLYFPNVTSIGNTSFYYQNYSGLSPAVYIFPRLISIGTTVGKDSGIFGLNVGRTTKFYCSSFLQTCNAGGVEGDLSFGITRRVTPVYVTNFISPNPITNLTVGTINTTSIQLNFTAPTGNTNAIEYYECWANGIKKNDITASGQSITGLVSGTNYNIKVIPVDIFYNKSSSNTLIVSTI